MSLCLPLLLVQPTHTSSLPVCKTHQMASKPKCKKQCNPVHPLMSYSEQEVRKWIRTKWQTKAELRDLDQPGLWPLPSTMPLNQKCVKPRSWMRRAPQELPSITAASMPQPRSAVLNPCRLPISSCRAELGTGKSNTQGKHHTRDDMRLSFKPMVACWEAVQGGSWNGFRLTASDDGQ